MEYFSNSALLPVKCSRFIRVACLCLTAMIFSSQALATEDEYKEKLLVEIRSSLSDKNKELAEQLVDIRIEEERKLGKVTLFQEVRSKQIITEEKNKTIDKVEEQQNRKNNWYFGLGVGSSDTGLYKIDLDGSTGLGSYTNYQNKSTGNKIFLGYKYSEEHSFELYYANLGKSSYSISTGWYATNKVVSYGASGKYHPIEILNTKPFFRYGVQKLSSVETGRTTYSNYSETNTSSSSRTLLGIGVDYSLNQLLTLTIEIEKYGHTGTTEAAVRAPIRVNPKVVYFSTNYSF